MKVLLAMKSVSRKYIGMLMFFIASSSLIYNGRVLSAEKSTVYNSTQQEDQHLLQELNRQGDVVLSEAAAPLLEPNVSSIEISQLPPPGRGFRSIELSNQGMTRNYLLYTPASYNPSIPTPVVIGFHGGGSANLVFSGVTSFHRLADQEGFLVVYPSGVNGYWNDGRGSVNSSIDDVGFVTALIEDLKRQRNIDARKVFVTGLSNGAYFVNRLACERSDLIAAFSSIAGSIPTPLMPGCNPIRPVPMMMVNSPNDKFVPWQGGESTLGEGGSILSIIEAANFWGGLGKCTTVAEEALPEIAPNDNTRVILRRYSNCISNSGLLLYIIEGGGHTWPGGSNQITSLLGPVSQEMNATGVSWNFFKGFILP